MSTELDKAPAEGSSPVGACSVPPLPDDAFAARLRGFGPLGIAVMLLILLTGNIFIGQVIVPVGATFVLLWAAISHTRWRDIGYVRPRNWALTIAIGIVFGVAFKFAMKALVMPLLGADPINRAYTHWTHNSAILPYAIWAMFVAGFAEETIFRGYLFERLQKLLGCDLWAKIAIVVVTSALFGAAHWSNQRLAGVEQATIVGLVFGTIAATRSSIAILMIAHTAFDLTALAMIYTGAETRIAHLIFK